MRPATATVAAGLIGEVGHLFCEMARLLLCDRNDHHKGDRHLLNCIPFLGL